MCILTVPIGLPVGEITDRNAREMNIYREYAYILSIILQIERQG